ncbi:MAG: hypothetical protein ACYC61_01075 [Isosphaeraceae bacterium]
MDFLFNESIRSANSFVECEVELSPIPALEAREVDGCPDNVAICDPRIAGGYGGDGGVPAFEGTDWFGGESSDPLGPAGGFAASGQK